jgi:rare lipoprotein A
VLAATGGISAAQAATGGASAYAGSSPETQEIVFSSPMRYGGASWYGPGLYGNKTACGRTLRPKTLGVAHKTLPCGTTVKFQYHGHVLVTQVIDRGPYVKGRSWDLTKAASEVLDLEGVGQVRYAVALNFARDGSDR